jgi:hypothetical protein
MLQVRLAKIVIEILLSCIFQADKQIKAGAMPSSSTNNKK